jgi:hypothetical protein
MPSHCLSRSGLSLLGVAGVRAPCYMSACRYAQLHPRGIATYEERDARGPRADSWRTCHPLEEGTGWRGVRPGFDVVVQFDSPKGSKAALIWLPCSEGITRCPCESRFYAAGAKRHSNVAEFLSLNHDKSAVVMIIRTTAELAEVLAVIRELRNGPVRTRRGRRW